MLRHCLRKIPANRDFYRDFWRKHPFGAIFVPNFPFVFRALYAEIPTRRNRDFCRAEQGFPRADQGTRRPAPQDTRQGLRNIGAMTSMVRLNTSSGSEKSKAPGSR